MSCPYTQQQLDAFWIRLSKLSHDQYVSITKRDSAAHEPGFVAMLRYVEANRLYGFANGGNKTAWGTTANFGPNGASPIFNGPIRS